MAFFYPRRVVSTDFIGLSSGALPRMQLLPSSNPKWLAESSSSVHSRCSVSVPWGANRATISTTNEKTLGLKNREMFSDLLFHFQGSELEWQKKETHILRGPGFRERKNVNPTFFCPCQHKLELELKWGYILCYLKKFKISIV